VLTVAHFPAAQDKDGVVDIYDCWYGRHDPDPEDEVVRPPRDNERQGHENHPTGGREGAQPS